jgi:hypothetical protein
MEVFGVVCDQRIKLAAFGPALRRANICKPPLKYTLIHEGHIPEPMINQM